MLDRCLVMVSRLMMSELLIEDPWRMMREARGRVERLMRIGCQSLLNAFALVEDRRGIEVMCLVTNP